MTNRYNEIRNNLAQLNKDIREAQKLRKSLRKEMKAETTNFQQQLVDAIVEAGPNGISSIDLAIKFNVPVKEVTRYLPHKKYHIGPIVTYSPNTQIVCGRSICVDLMVRKLRYYALIMDDGTVNTNFQTRQGNWCNHYVAE